MLFEVTQVPPKLRLLLKVGHKFTVSEAAQYFETNAATLLDKTLGTSFIRLDGVVMRVKRDKLD